MKRFLIVLIGLLCAPLVAYGAWQLVIASLAQNVEMTTLRVNVILILISLIVIVMVVDGNYYKPIMNHLASERKKEENAIHVKYQDNEITDGQKNLLIEKLDRKYAEAEKATLLKSIDRKYDTERTSGNIMIIFLSFVFFVTLIEVSAPFSKYEHIGNIIVTEGAIYSTNGEKIADTELYGWQKIEKDGETYIQYGSWNDSEIYDLNGNLVKVEEGL